MGLTFLPPPLKVESLEVVAARYWTTSLATSVLPAPDSPEHRIDWQMPLSIKLQPAPGHVVLEGYGELMLMLVR